MKKFFPIAFLFLSILANAQAPSEKELKKHQAKVAESKEKGKVILSLDTIFNSGIPYAVLNLAKKEIFKQDYSLKSLRGKELVYIRMDGYPNSERATGTEYYYSFLFMQSGNKAEVSYYDVKDMALFIVKNDLVKDTVVNSESEKRFLMIYPISFSIKAQNTTVVVVTNGTVVNNSSNYQTVDRNRSAAIYLYGSDLQQDFKTIGTITKSNSSVNGKYITTISFFLPNGTKVAEATGEGVNAKEWNVITLKDNSQHKMTTTFAEQEKQIAKYLSDLFYL